MSVARAALPAFSLTDLRKRPVAGFGRRELRLLLFLAAALYCTWCLGRIYLLLLGMRHIGTFGLAGAVVFGGICGLMAGFHQVLWAGVTLNWLRIRAGQRRSERPVPGSRPLRWYGKALLWVTVFIGIVLLPSLYPTTYWVIGMALGIALALPLTINQQGNRPARLLLAMPDGSTVIWILLMSSPDAMAYILIVPFVLSGYFMFLGAVWFGLGRKSFAGLHNPAFGYAGIAPFRSLAVRG